MNDGDPPPASPPPAGIPPYNPVYEKLVGPEASLVGLVAYGLYKTAKREWVEQHKPAPAEIGRYHTTVTQTQLSVYRAEAEARLAAYADSILESATPSIQKRALDDAVLAEVRKQNSLWRNALASVVGGVGFALILILGGVLLLGTPSLVDFVRSIPLASVPER